jgi:FkbM family methyltransferase
MLKNKVSTAYKLLREGGIKNLYDYSRVRLQVWTKERRKQVRLDNCLFSLEGITDDSIRIELFTNKYEAPERRAVLRYLKRDIPVIELGGSMGVVACVTNKVLIDPTAHVVVEANPLAIPQLELNRKLNGGKFEIVNRAVAYGADSITFRPSSDLAESSITRAGDQAPVTVDTVELGELVRDHGFERFTLVCDIEGLEYELVCHEADVLKNADTIIMETHARYTGGEKLNDMMAKLNDLGFSIVEEIGFVVVLQQAANVA